MCPCTYGLCVGCLQACHTNDFGPVTGIIAVVWDQVTLKKVQQSVDGLLGNGTIP